MSASKLVGVQKAVGFAGPVVRRRVVQQENYQRPTVADIHVAFLQMLRWYPVVNATMFLGILVRLGNRRAGNSEEEGSVTHT